jgi:hypothetical protein
MTTTFTRDGDRVVIRPDRARAREIMWYRSDAAIPTWTADVADDGACIRYTMTAIRVEPVDEYERPHLVISIEAHEEGAQHHGPHAVIAADQWRSMYVDLDEYDVADMINVADAAITLTHRWVAALLRVSAPMDRGQAQSLLTTASSRIGEGQPLAGMRAEDRVIAALVCPLTSLVPPVPETVTSVCDGCGAAPSSSERPGTGQFIEDNVLKFICYACWCVANYGRGSVETLEAKRQQKRQAP